MQCPTCQADIEGSPKFCPRCGSKLEQAAVAAASPPSVDPFLGQVVGGKYKIVKLLGEGGMGSVYLGEQMIGGTARKVAIKTLHQALSKDPKILARFERECETVAELQHPNTIQLYDFGKTDDGTLYMVMEFVQGKSLATLLEEKRALDAPRTQNILQQLCDALVEAHALGIVHRDLKPDNIVLTERAKDWVKLLDFGIAKRSEAQAKEEQKLTQQGTVLGTPPYMSPEQFTGKPIDLRSDIYSVGVIAYEMLSGNLPFNANTPWEWATQHMTVAPAMLTVAPTGEPIPESMKGAIMRALEKDPQNRFSTAREFFEAFSSGGAAPAVVSAGSAQKGKTEIGAPLSMPGAPYGTPGAGFPASPSNPGTYGPPPPNTGAYGAPPTNPGAYGAPPAPMQPQYTPAGGNVAFPTPVGIPQAPARAQGGGGTSGLLIAALSILGLLFAGAIVFGLTRGHSSASSPAVDLANANTAPETVVSAAPVPSDSSAVVALDTSIATLTPPRPPPPGPMHHPDGGGGHEVTPPVPPTAPTTPVPPLPTPNPPPTPAGDPKECQTARKLEAAGKDKTLPAYFNALKVACLAQHGHI